jgi:hypothetical protein
VKKLLRERSDIPRFFISICNISGEQDVGINGFLFSRDSSDDYLECDWKTLKGISPVRESLGVGGIFISP